MPVLPCACANLRRAARAVTRIYDRELRAVGLEPTQYSLLMALDIRGELTQGELGGLLVLDTTTLTRMLKPLTMRGWISERPGKDRRQRFLRLSASGKLKLLRARPHWKRAQKALKQGLGEPTWSRLGDILAQVASASVGE